MQRLSAESEVPKTIIQPKYKPEDHAVGIVHLGLGAFHRAHQAVYTDRALQNEGGDWRITGISLRSAAVPSALHPQGGRYLLLEQGVDLPEDGRVRLVASIANALNLSNDRPLVSDTLADPCTKIVSLTITEKAYYIDRESGAMQTDSPVITHDLQQPENPESAIGLIVQALATRKKSGTEPFTVLCCDNLPENGKLVRAGVLDFARRVDPDLGQWIENNVAFPSTMVDRITPAITSDILESICSRAGYRDEAAVVTESFSQWVIEDNFPQGRPAWETAGAVFVKDVAPFEAMKLRMLNGAHSLLAYTGFLAGYYTVSEAMAFRPIASLVKEHMRAAAATLKPLDQIDYENYSIELCKRFENPGLNHATYQIAMDGTQKLPQRLLEATVDTLRAKGQSRTFALAVAAWMRYCLGVSETGDSYELRDPRQDEIALALANAHSDSDKVQVLFELPGLFPQYLQDQTEFRSQVATNFTTIQREGIVKLLTD